MRRSHAVGCSPKDFGDLDTISHNDIDIDRISIFLLTAIDAFIVVASLEKLSDVLPNRRTVGKTNDAIASRRGFTCHVCNEFSGDVNFSKWCFLIDSHS